MPLCILWDRIFQYNSSESQKSSTQENILFLSEKYYELLKITFFFSKTHWIFFCGYNSSHNIWKKYQQSCKTVQDEKCFIYMLFFWLFMTKSSLYILSDSYTSKNMLGTKNVRYGGIFKASKKTCQITHIVETARAKTLSPILW